MVEEQSANSGFLDMCFWTEHCGDCICLNVFIKGYQFSSPPIDRIEWMEWLRAEQEECHPISVPTAFWKAFDG